MRVALIAPEIPQNVGAVLRLGACLGAGVDLVGPLGFAMTEKRLRRAGMDYIDLAETRRFDDLETFLATDAPRRILLTTRGDARLHDFAFLPGDTLMFGNESSGAPEAAHRAADARLRIPMRPEARSLNLALAVTLALGEALRQTGGLPQ